MAEVGTFNAVVDKKTVVSPSTNEDPGKAATSPEKVCAICGDKATGMHFGAMTCEGCKGFFRRSVNKNANFTCSFENNCGVNKVNRKQCQACRYKACIAVGMNSSLILSEEEVNKKRDLIKSNREKRLEQQQVKKNTQEQQRLKKLAEISKDESSIRMTMEEKLLIETLLRGHQESYDFGYEEYETFRGKEKITTPNKKTASSNTSFAWLVASMSKEDVQAQYEAMQNLPSSLTPSTRKPALAPEAVGKAKIPTTKTPENQEVFSSLHGTSENVDDLACSSASITDKPGFKDGFNKNKNKPDTSTTEEEQPETDADASTSKTKYENSSSSSDCPKPAPDSDSLSYLRGLLRSQGFSLADVEDTNSKQLLQHFCDIMTWGIKKVIDFCKSIPQFLALSLVDQIVLLRGGCLEMLVLRSYFAFSSKDNKYLSEKFQYHPSDFLQAGASPEFIEKYNNLHIRMRKMKLQVEEICLLLALVLFSPDRPGLEEHDKVEKTQFDFAKVLQAYEYTHKPPKQARTAYCELLLILPILRTINMLFAANLISLQETNESDMNPLILEVNSPANVDDDN